MGFSEAGSTSSQKGESLEDTIRVIGSFADVIVLRHPEAGAATRAAGSTKTPVVNAGDGANEHPSQTLVDLFAMRKSQGTIDGLTVAIVGDLKYGRTVHSLVKALMLYQVKIHFASPRELALPEDLKEKLKKKDITFSCHERIEDVLKDADVVYMTRVQKERLQGEVLKSPYILRKEMLAGCKKNMKILHPLPRIDELEKEIDKTPFAYYFEQAQYGVPVRMALLTSLLKK
jgi:aspartate carbamoyltransferase catalytic subunit